jgi:ATP-binding cassette subfamily B multidrug efflux pump
MADAAQRYHEEENLGKAFDGRLMKRLLAYLRPSLHLVLITVALQFLLTWFEILTIDLGRQAIDDCVALGSLQALNRIAMLYALLLVLSFFARFAFIYLTSLTGQRVIFTLRLEVFSRLQKFSPAFFDHNPVGRLMTRVTNDVQVLNEMFTSGLVVAVSDITLIIGIMGYLLYRNWLLALITFSILPILFYISFLFKRKVRDAYRMIRIRLARINSYVQENLSGMRVVQLFRREQRNREHFEEINQEHTESNLRSVLYYSIFFPSIEVVNSLAIALIVWFGGLEALAGNFTLGELFAFLLAANKFFRPIRDLSEKYNIMQTAMASSERIFNLLDTRERIVEPSSPEILTEFRDAIRFEGVDFHYEAGQPVLRDVTLEVRRGQRVAVVGATGAGKTTLISLLARFYDVQSGRITIDGIDVRRMKLDQLRRLVGVVQQDVFLFAGDVASNISLWDERIRQDNLVRAAKSVGIHDFITGLPGGYGATVVERGATLSTGQRQLLSFARALAYDPQILVLDEATSSVDTETELRIQKALEVLLRGRTSIIIAHRISTIQNADRIIVMHRGRVRETGDHASLLERKGIYFRLHQLQYRQAGLLTRRT